MQWSNVFTFTCRRAGYTTFWRRGYLPRAFCHRLHSAPPPARAMCHAPDGNAFWRDFCWRPERPSYPHPIVEPSCCTVLVTKDNAFSRRFRLVRRKPKRSLRVLHPVSRPSQTPPLKSSKLLQVAERKMGPLEPRVHRTRTT
ncbi:hypothetical protein HPB48_015989 [Haemaphysalis longicornis]|uniref:Uncharacterized protein n=1 Tax=Haemaphysalis longicornis TaxID=44386 RepID=A0A9J6F993_HAELO|nr:hypothetical protein HPB48_015989 [Haemaphysalis longicornis]